MNQRIEFVQNWLVEGEVITHYVDEVFIKIQPCQPIKYFYELLPDASTPQHKGSLILTNRRLILIEPEGYTNVSLPRWYCVTAIASLSERPPKYSTDRQGHDYPYQAYVTLYSGVMLILETPKDEVENRGRILSHLLVNALTQLRFNQQEEHLSGEYFRQNEE